MGTGPAVRRFAGMTNRHRTCLITNAQSGSNDDDAVAQLRGQLLAHGFELVRDVSFPDDDLPAPTALDADGIALVAIFTGDGTLNAALDALAGWHGAVLVLPGGTMNLLFHRLHGEASLDEVLSKVAGDMARRVRSPIIACAAGNAYAGLLAGPGAAWSDVREAMREYDVLDLAQSTVAAIAETLGGAGVVCRQPAFGQREGYPLILLNAQDDGILALAYHARTPGDYLAQGWALMRRNFREGPHDVLGKASEVTLASSDGAPFGLLLDGEPADAGSQCTFRLVRSEVDLLATVADG
jgi:hypothetical protein